MFFERFLTFFALILFQICYKYNNAQIFVAGFPHMKQKQPLFERILTHFRPL